MNIVNTVPVNKTLSYEIFNKNQISKKPLVYFQNSKKSDGWPLYHLHLFKPKSITSKSNYNSIHIINTIQYK